MPRSGRSGGRSSGFSRQAPRQSAPTPQRRSNVPAAQPASSVAAPQQQAKQPGLFANMASTAAGVAVGSTIVCLFTSRLLCF